MPVEDVTSGNGNEPRDSSATSTIFASKMDSVVEMNLYADRNGNENEVRDENEIRDAVSQCNISCEKVEDTSSYNDENVKQCELPEVMVRCEYGVVKDIWVDKGVPFKDKIVVESESDNTLCTFLPLEETQNGTVTKERGDSELLSSNGSKSSSENDYNEEDIQEWGTKEEVVDMESLLADALKSLLENHLVDDIGNDGRSLAIVQTGEANYTTMDKIVDDGPKVKSLKSLFESSNSDGSEVQLQSDQIPHSESECEATALVSTTEESKKTSPVNDLYYNSMVGSATITFDFNSSKPTASNRNENSDDIVPLKIDSEPARHEDGISRVSAVGSEIQEAQGESSFSMAGPVSGPITYSGPMTYSGSVSLRSDSSTTSTRSFAFPVIQSEWNSSPIRMAKADRRHYRKHRGWIQGLLCCRF